MKSLWVAGVTAVALVTGSPVDACDLMYQVVFPSRETVRLAGTVIAHVPAAAPGIVPVPPTTIAVDARPAAVRIAVREVLSGPVNDRETVVAPLPYAADCRSFAATFPLVERDYPVGSEVLVRGRPTGSRDIPVIAEMNREEFVVKAAAMPRTAQGDLDFRQSQTQHRSIVDFEFDRAVLTLNGRGDRFARLENLAHYRGWAAMPNARARYAQLVVDSGLGGRQQAALLDHFQQLNPLVK